MQAVFGLEIAHPYLATLRDFSVSVFLYQISDQFYEYKIFYKKFFLKEIVIDISLLLV